MELTRFLRRIELPGVEMLEVVDSQRPWRCVSSAFELMMPGTWQGEIRYRGARHQVGPGMLFCPGPGDIFEILRAEVPGSFRVLMIAPELLRDGLAEHGLSPESPAFHRVVGAVPEELAAALMQLLTNMRFDSAPMKLQSSLEELKWAIANHSFARGETQVRPGAALGQRLRELIDADVEGKLDLEALSREMGLTRFQVLRAFKRSHGLPPYAYQLCVRITQAQRLLSTGHSPANVASELRFTDQSHLTRHFKRMLGVTPSVYARASLGSKVR